MSLLMRPRFASRKDERGQTILLVVVCIAGLIGMAALAIDIATLYTASNETRRTAEAAALAGALKLSSVRVSRQGGCHKARYAVGVSVLRVSLSSVR